MPPTVAAKPAQAARRRAENPPGDWFARWGTLLIATLGSVLYWAALPPANLWPLAWAAPVGWVWLARRSTLPGRRPYLALWAAGFVFWFPTLHWLRLPHPATSVGWLALSVYLACYWPLFVALVRVAAQQLKLSVVLAAPLVWMGVEKAQAHMFTGFNMGGLGQTQYRWIELIQAADLLGFYTVSAVVMFVAACVARALPCDEQRGVAWPLAAAAAMLAATLGYGYFRVAGEQRRPGPTISLIQGSIDSELKYDPARQQRVQDEYLELTYRAVAQRPDANLIVWPETMCRYKVLSCTDDARPAEGEAWQIDLLRQRAAEHRDGIEQMARAINRPDDPRDPPRKTSLLLGVDALHYGPGTVALYNSAQFVAADGALGPRYDKMHPVLFGEYVPLAKRWPWLYRFTPLGGGIETGTDVPLMTVQCRDGGSARLAASVCYETVLSRVIHRQFALARERGEDPDVLVNLTNDGWFRGSSELDLHLICGVFRAVEHHRPLVIAANTGISAWIDSSGRIRRQGPRRATDVIIADVELDGRRTLYSLVGEWPAAGALAACGVLAVVGLAPRRRQRRSSTPSGVGAS